MKRAGGRPSKLTRELQEKICTALRTGNYLETAAAFAGVRKSTLHDWLRRGARARRGIFRELSDAVEKAMADAEARDVALVGKAAVEGSWQAAAWRLERKHPDRWGRQDRVAIQNQVKAELEAALDTLEAQLPKDEYERVLTVLGDATDDEKVH